MTPQRLFNFTVALALILVVALTAWEAAATSAVISGASAAETYCASLPSHRSLHTEYVKERGVWVTSTEDGPTGVDGGLIQLLSDYQDCSR